MLSVLLLGVSASSCPADCECYSDQDCTVGVRCVTRAPDYPRGLDPQTDCLTISNPLLAKLTNEDKQSFFESLPTGLRMLDLSMSGLGFGDGLPAKAFSRVPELVFLNLEFNRLKELPEDVFHGLKKLRVLYLTGNHWQAHEEGYKRAEILGNRITQIPPDTFNQLRALRVLLLHHNRLKAHGPDKLDGGLFGFQRDTLLVLKIFDQAHYIGASMPPLSTFESKRMCAKDAPSRGECLQLETEGDRGDVLEDMMVDAGVLLAEEPKFEAWLREVSHQDPVWKTEL